MWGTFSRLVDDFALLSVVLSEQRRGFSATGPGEPPSFEELLEEVRGAPPAIDWPARLDRRARVPVRIPAVRGRTCLEWWPAQERAQPADTLVVFHHGLGEVLHDGVPRMILARSGPLRERCDWAVLKALHHEAQWQVSGRFTAHRDHFMRYLLGSASVARRVAKDLGHRYRHLVLCGLSLGGLVTQVEACREGRFHLYVPFVSGPDLRDVLCHSAFTRTIQGAHVRQARSGRLRMTLDLAALLARDPHGPPIRPLLGTHDQLFRYPAQSAAWARVPRARISTVAGGHLTGAANFPALRRHLLRALDETVWAAQPSAAPAPSPAPSQVPIAVGG